MKDENIIDGPNVLIHQLIDGQTMFLFQNMFGEENQNEKCFVGDKNYSVCICC